MSVPATPLHPEGPRYRAALVFVPGLWAGPDQWRRAAGFLAHRGWEGVLADPAAAGGDAAARAGALAALVDELERPAVLLAHDAAGPIALEVARRARVAAVLWVGPLVPGGDALRTMVSPWRVLAALLLGAAPPRPAAWTQELASPGWARPDEAPGIVVDAVRGRTPIRPVAAPTALVVGADDVCCGERDRVRLQRDLAADLIVVPDARRYPLAGPHWRAAASAVHRWLVQRLGEDLLEYYEEAMAERGDAETDG